MNFFRQLAAVPAYYAVDAENRCIPFIVSLLLHDTEGLPRITPAVEAAINRTIEVTGRGGLITAIIHEENSKSSLARFANRAIEIDDAILLFRCQNAATSEALMLCMDELFAVSLVKCGCRR